MTADPLPRIWCERPVLPAMVATVGSSCQMLGPGTDDDRYDGIEDASAAIAGAAVYDGPVMDRAPGGKVLPSITPAAFMQP